MISRVKIKSKSAPVAPVISATIEGLINRRKFDRRYLYWKYSFNLILILILLSPALKATTYSWSLNENGSWKIPSNWTPAGVPVSGDAVIFNNCGTIKITNIPSLTLSGLNVTGTSEITFEAENNNVTLILNGSLYALSVNKESSLTLKGADKNSSTIAFGNGISKAIIAGTLNVLSGGIFKTVNSTTTISGTLVKDGNAIVSGTVSNLTVSSGGKIKLTGTSLSIPMATWQQGADCEIEVTKGGTLTGLGQSFSNFIINCPFLKSSLQCHGSLTAVNGDLKIINTNSSSGNIFSLTDTTDYNLNIRGNLVIGNNAFLDLTNNLGYSAIYLQGDLSATGNGQIACMGMGDVDIYFSKPAGVQMVNLENRNSFDTANFSASVFIGTGTTANTVKLYADMNLGPNWSEVLINKGSALDFQNFILRGAQATFTAAAGSTLITGNENGIARDGLSGSVQAGSFKTYTPEANYVYNGKSRQCTGTALSAANNLTVDNKYGVTQTNDIVAVNGILTLTDGIYDATGQKVIVSNNVSCKKGYVNGNLRKSFATGNNLSRSFEIGDDHNFAPVTVTFASIRTSGSVTASTSGGDNGNISASSINARQSINRNWNLSNKGMLFTSCKVTLNYDASDVDDNVNISKIGAGIFNGKGWVYPSMGLCTATSAQVTAINTLGIFQLGVINPYSPLALESFSAQLNNHKGNISWTANDESQTDCYSLERSVNGKVFSEISRTPANHQNASHNIYTHTDEDLLQADASEVFYRLNRFGMNGDHYYSNVISLKESKSSAFPAIKVFPNPGNGFFNLEINSEYETDATVELMDRTSRIVFSDNIHLFKEENERTVDVRSLPKDIYLLKVTTDLQTQTIKTVIQ